MTNKTLIQINQSQMGIGDNKLGKLLILKYLTLLSEKEIVPAFIVFYNSGIELLCNDDPSMLAVLKELEQKGCKLIGCSTCFEFFKMKEHLKIGFTGSMTDIIDLQSKVDKVITI